MLKCIYLFVLIYATHAYAIDYKSYTREDWEKVIFLISIVVLIVSPSKFRVVVIGTILGLAFAYFTYKYAIPFLLS